jgi:hypothetical protein
MMMEVVPETLISFDHLMKLMAQEVFLRCESFIETCGNLEA